MCNEGAPSPSKATLCGHVNGALSDGRAFYLLDGGNHRLLKWTAFPSRTGQAADLVLGQPDGRTVLGGEALAAAGDRAFGSVDAAARVGDGLVVSDCARKVFAGWTTAPTADGQPFDFVVPFPAGSTCWRAMSGDGRRLVAADGARVFVWDDLAALRHGAPRFVIGQRDAVSTAANAEGITAYTLSDVTSSFYAAGRLFVVDHSNRRVLRYALPP
jgi:hypothetical protein